MDKKRKKTEILKNGNCRIRFFFRFTPFCVRFLELNPFFVRHFFVRVGECSCFCKQRYWSSNPSSYWKSFSFPFIACLLRTAKNHHAHNWYKIAAHWIRMEKDRWVTGANNDWFTCGPKRAPRSHTMQLSSKNTCSTLQCKCRKNELPCSQACGDCRGVFAIMRCLQRLARVNW